MSAPIPRLDVAQFQCQRPPFGVADLRRRVEPIRLFGPPGDHIFETIRHTGTFYEIDLLELVARRLKQPAGVIVDVGANIGNHTVYFAKVLGARVVSIEPQPVAAEVLRRNLAVNEVAFRVHVVQAAAGERSGVVHLVSSQPGNLGATAVSDVTFLERADAGIPMRTLDDICEEEILAGNSVAFIKVDVEGFESRVLAGSRRVLERHRPLLAVELATREAFATVWPFLKQLGYEWRGPLCATPTYLFGFALGTRLWEDLLYRGWRSYSRGRLRRWLIAASH